MTFPGGVAGILLLMLGAPALAGAQTFEPPKLTIGAAGGVSYPLHGDFQYVAPSWDASVQGQAARHLTVEGFLSRWRHSSDRVLTNMRSSGPGGSLGRIGEVTIESGESVAMAGLTFLSTFSRGRFTVAGGSGPAVMIFRSDYAQRFSGCDPVTACSNSEVHYTNGTFAVQLDGSVDVRLASRLTTFGQVRVGVPIEDPGSGHVAATVGLRLVLR